MLDTKKLAENIRKFRRRRKMTETAVARKLFVTPQTVSKWENAVAVPDLYNFAALCDLLSVTPNEILGLEDSKDLQKKLIGIDGGGTKTDFVLFSEDGTVLKRLTLGSTNPSTVGFQKAAETLRIGVDRFLAMEPSVSQVFAGLAGATAGDNRARFMRFFRMQYPHLKFDLDSDIQNVIHSVRGVKKCIALISGTGSVVYGSDGEKLRSAGGNGFFFDGAGSGFDIGRDAISHCLSVEDGIASPSLLYGIVKDTLEDTVQKKLADIYSRGVDYIAGFAPLVFDAAGRGDEVAKQILDRNMQRLGKLVTYVQSKMDTGRTVIFAGGLSNRLNELEPLLSKYLPKNTKIIVPEFPPVYGACVKCLEIAGVKTDPDKFDTLFQKTLLNETSITYGE
ncbi:MAG: XRE family transcriptional regulator [Lachnospiraceae bacterium]|nr:XRE family transcriptional regulator [Lachnospiraceae bacterium]